MTAARAARKNAYAPYSSFSVGAAVRTADGLVFSGTNVENASYGLTMCAERVAIFTAIAAGATNLKAIAITSGGSRLVSPCGACRQVMAEHLPLDASVLLDGEGGQTKMVTVGELLPLAFVPSDLPGESS
ncbi:cytidine deaminase [Ramlibacter solisilvae]